MIIVAVPLSSLLQAKVSIGEPAHSIAFSPDGNHLAVGTVAGSVKVLLASDMSQLVAQVGSGFSFGLCGSGRIRHHHCRSPAVIQVSYS